MAAPELDPAEPVLDPELDAEPDPDPDPDPDPESATDPELDPAVDPEGEPEFDDVLGLDPEADPEATSPRPLVAAPGPDDPHATPSESVSINPSLASPITVNVTEAEAPANGSSSGWSAALSSARPANGPELARIAP